MATPPSAALQMRPQPSFLEQYGQVQSILGQRQEQQVRGLQIQQAQLSLADQQAATKAMQQWDGQDYNDLPALIKKNGGSLNAVLDTTQKIVARQQQNATLDETQLKNNQTRADQYRGRIQAVIDADPSQQDALWAAEIAKERQEQQTRGAPGGAQPPGATDKYPGDDTATYIANHFALGSTLAKEASEKTAAQARATTANTAQQQFAAKTDPNSPLYDPSAAYLAKKAAAGDPEAQGILTQQQKQAGAVAGAQAAAKQPYEMQLEQVRQQVAQTFQSNKNAQDKIEGTVLKPYEEKMSQITELQSAVQQAAQGNVTAARGVLLKLIGVTNPDGTKRYNEAEATRLLQQGNIADRFAGTVKNLLTGDQWTNKMQNDMLSFAGAQSDVAKGNLNRGIGNVNKLYNTNVGQGLVQPTTVKMKAPNGMVKDVDLADVDHYKKMGATMVNP